MTDGQTDGRPDDGKDARSILLSRVKILFLLSAFIYLTSYCISTPGWLWANRRLPESSIIVYLVACVDFSYRTAARHNALDTA